MATDTFYSIPMFDENDFEDYDLTIPCPVCGEAVYEDAPQCSSCGEYIIESSIRRKRFSPWFYALIIVIVVLTIVSFLMPMF